MRHSIIGFCAALALASSVSAMADEPTAEPRLMMASFADCVVETEPRRAQSVVLDGLEAGESLRGNSPVVVTDCLPVDDRGTVMIDMRPSLIRYALAEALVRREPSLTLANPASIPPLDHGVARGDELESKRANIAISRFGECVVRVAPTQSAALVATTIASGSESSASEALKPAVSSCLAAGQTVVLPLEMLRGAVALNYYRLAKATRLPAREQTR